MGFSTSYTWTVPEGVTGVDVLVVGGGGGGGYDGGGGGGGGKVVELRGVSVTPYQSIPIVIGLGGRGGLSKDPLLNINNGLPGQSSSFGSIIVALDSEGGGGGSSGGNGKGGSSGSGFAGRAGLHSGGR